MFVKILIVCALCLSKYFVVAQGFIADSYVGAVVEYSPIVDKDEKTMIKLNVAEYKKLMAKAAEKGADIIVFPEGGLNIRTEKSPIPDPLDRIVPCDSTSFQTTETVKALSCASKDNNIYSVVNLVEKRSCEGEEDCPSDKFFTYNTNVVFDRKGMVVARYAKFNLFDEPSDKPREAEMVYFDTDFGVRFGTFICFDILFTVPTQRLVQQYGITDFVYTTHWFSELPYLTALQAQRGWAEANNVNLLASGYNAPGAGSSGSGIYNGKFGKIVEFMTETKTTKLLMARIPKIQREKKECLREERSILPQPLPLLSESSRVSNSSTQTSADDTESTIMLLADQIYLFNTEVVEPNKKFERKLCSQKGFCCDFEMKVDLVGNNTKKYTYRAMVMNGVRKFGKEATGGVQACGVVLCSGPNPGDCTGRVRDAAGLFRIRKIKIEGEFLSRNAFQMPTTLTDGAKLAPLPVYMYEFIQNNTEKGKKVTMELNPPVTNLHTFGIWGRDVTRDGEIPYIVAKASLTASVSIVCTVFSVLVLAWQ